MTPGRKRRMTPRRVANYLAAIAERDDVVCESWYAARAAGVGFRAPRGSAAEPLGRAVRVAWSSAPPVTLLHLVEAGKPTMSLVIYRDLVGDVRNALDWLMGAEWQGVGP